MFDKNIESDWFKYLPLVQRIINSTVKESTGHVPATIIFGGSVDLTASLFQSPPSDETITLSEWVKEYVRRQQTINHVVTQLQLTHQQRHHAQGDYVLPSFFQEGAYVLVDYVKSSMGTREPTK
jgi:hypothetical protein